MKLTNNYNLPFALVKAMGEPRKPVKDRFSISDLISPPQIRYYKEKFWDKLEEDASSRLWALLGNSVHFILDKGQHPESLTEEKLTSIYMGVTISGIPDLWHDWELSDWKVTSVYSFLLGDKPEWEQQLNLYKWLYEQNGFKTEKLTINAILRDWQESKKLKDKDYPEIPFVSVNITIWASDALQSHLEVKVRDLLALEPRPCTDDERWLRGETWAVMREKRKTAVKVCNSEVEAQEYLDFLISAQKIKEIGYIEHRKGSYVRCERYCPVHEVCSQWAIDKN